jgi:DNA polymerase type B, organellar and viral
LAWALAAYGSSYLPDNLKKDLKMIKGELERELRSAYFGGNVEVYINEIYEAYLYDLHSQYPKAMLEDMPMGNPVLSLETNLDKIFGFVYGAIICPNENTLQVPFIQYKDYLNKNVVCPRGKFKRLIFSEEIKYALRLGYKKYKQRSHTICL